MNSVLEALYSQVEKDPLPQAYTSSHWRQFGQQTQVQKIGDRLDLRGVGFGDLYSDKWHHRVMHAACRFSYRPVSQRVSHFSKTWKMAKQIAREAGFGKTYDLWRYAMVLGVLADHWVANDLKPKTFTLIGDGYGVLGALIHRWIPDARLYYIDLPKILIFQVSTQEKLHPQKSKTLLAPGISPQQINFVTPEHIQCVSEEIDCAINMASMAEMDPKVTAGYFRFLRERSSPDSLFYCINRRLKVLPDGEVADFLQYPWSSKDTVYLDGPCPFYTHFLSVRSAVRGPKWMGMRVPFVNYFDEEHYHRLVHLERNP